ncbi:hypothetical protein BKA69DRAFT_391618 [Paraphysoderma sedebokerense]|nr:hypothetical protein BKA69DRAFT_391618 [Paraphysoderma sedebokerense]
MSLSSHIDDRRRVYGLQEAKLQPLLLKAYTVDKVPSVRKIIDGWQSAGIAEQNNNCRSDFAEVFIKAMGLRIPAKSTSPITIGEVGHLLDELASHHSNSNLSNDGMPSFTAQKCQQEIMKQLFGRLSRQEVKWMVRIILKKTFLYEYQYHSIIYHFHMLMKPIYNVYNNLVIACEEIQKAVKAGISWDCKPNSSQWLAIVKEWCPPRLFVNIAIPRLDKLGNGAQIWFNLQGNNCFAETKYDGERMQIHFERKGPSTHTLRIFSKSKRDSTIDRIGCHSIILDSIHSSVRNCILEGELLLYNEEEQRIESFNELREFGKYRSQNDENTPPEYVSKSRHYFVVFFDILYLNDENFLFTPFKSRRTSLESMIVPIARRSILSQTKFISLETLSVEDGINTLLRYFFEAIKQGDEGLVIKPANAPYNSWRDTERAMKWKKDYVPGVQDTIDFVAFAGYTEKERLIELGWSDPFTPLTTFVLGLMANKWEVENLNENPIFQPMFTVSIGLGKEELRNVHQYLIKHKRPFQHDTSMFDYQVNYSHYPGSKAAWFLLKDPLVFEVKGTELMRECGQDFYSVRFPRVQKVRTDLTFTDTMSYDEFQDLAKRLDGRNWGSQDLAEVERALMYSTEAFLRKKEREIPRSKWPDRTRSNKYDGMRPIDATTTIPPLVGHKSNTQCELLEPRACLEVVNQKLVVSSSVVTTSPKRSQRAKLQTHDGYRNNDKRRKLVHPNCNPDLYSSLFPTLARFILSYFVIPSSLLPHQQFLQRMLHDCLEIPRRNVFGSLDALLITMNKLFSTPIPGPCKT